ncbi:META domain-containing protein [Schumannella sp. 10F1B-5-1]|uniref:META domain-containing protein n=1 Tax=Schumannella sp. 10F1B-5-1 TaxID=2590780 RepID=UPI0011317C65|nr:META domain-containing protein [Schumannella sp. 10F1B-5-1]TPW70045.1 META domain-containing protein [Schumannella sp. 10F1B-5-1]
MFRPTTPRARLLLGAPAAAVLALGLLAGCSSGDDAASTDDASSSPKPSASTPESDSGAVIDTGMARLWPLASITDAEGTLAPPTVSATLDLREADKVSGQGGCNGFGADATLGDGGSLVIGPIVSTKRACADPDQQAQETRYLAALDQVDKIAQSGDTLTLTGGGVELVYSADTSKSAGPKTDDDSTDDDGTSAVVN